MRTFDKLDRAILAILDTEGRATASEIARKVRRGRDTVAYRIQRLVSEEILQGSEPIINPASLGLGLYKSYVSFAQANQSLDRVHKRTVHHADCYCVAKAHGRWDLIFNMVASTPNQFMELRNSLFAGEEKHIRELGFSLFTRMVHYNRKYLGSPSKNWTTISTTSQVELDDTDRAILQALARDARRADAEIAREIETTPMVVSHRLKNLEKSGVIVGYRARLNRNELGLSSYKLQIELRDLSQKSLSKIETFAREHEFVTQFMLQLGSWPCEINVDVYDNRHLATLIDELREAVGAAIGLIEVTLYDRDLFTWGFGAQASNSIDTETTMNAA